MPRSFADPRCRVPADLVALAGRFEVRCAAGRGVDESSVYGAVVPRQEKAHGRTQAPQFEGEEAEASQS